MTPEEKEFLERIEKHKGIIFKISKMYMDNKEDQEDLFQEIVLQIWKSYSGFQHKSSFSTWMYRVAINTAIIFLRTDKKRSFVDKNKSLEHFENVANEPSSEKEIQMQKMFTAIQAPGLVWSARSAWRRGLSRMICDWQGRRWRNAATLRLGLHPVDMRHPASRDYWLQTLQTLLAQGRQPLTKSAWLARQVQA